MATKPVIVLVPGLFHKPSSWDKVAKPLRDQGFTVLTPPLAVGGDLTGKTPASPEWKELASKSFADDKAIILKELMPLLDEGREAVLVGHSFGSIPATLAVEGNSVAERKEKGLKGGVVALVVVAGFAYPVRGKSVMGDDSEPPLMPYHVLEEGIIHLQPSATPLWYSDLSPEGQAAAWADLDKTSARKAMTQFPDYIASDVKLPKTYIFTEKDEAVSPDYQSMFLGIGQFENVVKIPTGHAPMLSAPEKMVEILIDVAAKAYET